jgi:hypothetical protein
MVDEVEANSIWAEPGRVVMLKNRKVNIEFCQGCTERELVLIATYIL